MQPTYRFLTALFLCLPLWAAAQQPFAPVDDAAAAPDFFSFRAQLQAALARRDTAAVEAALDPSVKLSFGGDGGLEAFRRIWKPREPNSALWETLATVLALGGSFQDKDNFVAPYVFARWPQDKDSFANAAVVGSSVRVREAPSSSAPMVATLDFSIVELVPPRSGDTAGWSQIKLPGGKTGHVAKRYLRSPIDYRVFFSKKNGQWKVVMFLAGD